MLFIQDTIGNKVDRDGHKIAQWTYMRETFSQFRFDRGTKQFQEARHSCNTNEDNTKQ